MFSKACTYGIRAVLYLAVHSKEGRNISIDELAEALDVPKHFLGKILQELVRKEIISSKKGPGGGFFMTQEDLQQPLTKVVEAIDGPAIFNSCVLGFETCGKENPCPLHVQAFAFREGLKYQMSSYTIEDMATRIRRDHIKI